MKLLQHYLMENKKVYYFKVRIAGDIPTDINDKIKAALVKFNVIKCKKCITTPVQNKQADFPDLENVNVTTFDINTDYPATAEQIRDAIADALEVSTNFVIVRTEYQYAEELLNHETYDLIKSNIKEDPLLLKDYEKTDNSHLYGSEFNVEFLKELHKTKHLGIQYKGVNDKLLAAAPPKKGKSTNAISSKSPKSNSPIGSIKPKPFVMTKKKEK